MIIEPTPTNPRSPLRRALRLAGLVLPGVLLVGVIAAGALGPKPEAPPPSMPPARTVAGPAGTAATGPLVAGSAISGIDVPEPWGPRDPRTTTAIQAAHALPDRFGALQAMAPSEVVANGVAGTLAEVVAVAGYLAMDGAESACADAPLGPLGPWCDRHGVIADGSWSISPPEGISVIPPHLHVTVPVGVRLPDVVASMAVAERRVPVPVVLLGRLAAPPTCSPAWHGCEADLTVDRIAWADGVRVGLTPLADTRIQASDRRPNPFSVTIDRSQVPLMAVLAWPQTIPSIDPAAGAVAAKQQPAEPVWYVRVITHEGRGPASHGGRPAVRWLLLDDRELRVIATGRPASAPVGPNPG